MIIGCDFPAKTILLSDTLIAHRLGIGFALLLGMFARIHARDDIKVKTKGHKLEVTASGFETQATDGKLIIRAEEWEYIGPKNERFYGLDDAAPSERNVERTLTLEFTAQDLANLFDAAMRAGLIHVKVEAAPIAI